MLSKSRKSVPEQCLTRPTIRLFRNLNEALLIPNPRSTRMNQEDLYKRRLHQLSDQNVNFKHNQYKQRIKRT